MKNNYINISSELNKYQAAQDGDSRKNSRKLIHIQCFPSALQQELEMVLNTCTQQQAVNQHIPDISCSSHKNT